jgi:hypothetical protein
MDQEDESSRAAEIRLLAHRAVTEHGTKHLRKFEALGIRSEAELVTHVEVCLNDPNVLCIPFEHGPAKPWRKADIYFHEATNTAVVVAANPAHASTVYRTDNPEKWLPDKTGEAGTAHEVVVSRGYANFEKWKSERQLATKRQNERTIQETERKPVKLYDPDEARRRRIADAFSRSSKRRPRERDDERER